MGGPCPGAPELKGPPRERQKKKKKENENRKEKRKEKKRENETFQIPRRGLPSNISPLVEVDDSKYQNQTLVISHNL